MSVVQAFLSAGVRRGIAEREAPGAERAMLESEITTQPRAAMFIAQVLHESGGLNFFEEIASGAAYEGRADLGNVHRGDGTLFKGRGPIQLTGRNNYHLFSQLLKLPLEEQPELAAKPKIAFRTAALFWRRIGANELADAGNFREITHRINGGFNGLQDREQRLAAIKALGPKAVLPELTRVEKWRNELRKRREQLKTETEHGTRSFLIRRINELKRALRRERDKHGPHPIG
jgi:predicted chitinase